VLRTHYPPKASYQQTIHILLGGSGNDKLDAGAGFDLIIGGLGMDVLIGGKGEDILIGGTTTSDDDEAALKAVLAAWLKDESYVDRVAAIDALLTVEDDDEEDVLTGDGGLDLFYNGLRDDLKDRNDDETIL